MDGSVEVKIEYNAEKLHAQLCTAGLPIYGVTSEGRIDWLEKPTEAMLAQAESIKSAHVPVTAQDELQTAYRSSGITIEAMVQALWQRLVENDPTAVDALQARMQEIRVKMSTAAQT